MNPDLSILPEAVIRAQEIDEPSYNAIRGKAGCLIASCSISG